MGGLGKRKEDNYCGERERERVQQMGLGGTDRGEEKVDGGVLVVIVQE